MCPFYTNNHIYLKSHSQYLHQGKTNFFTKKSTAPHFSSSREQRTSLEELLQSYNPTIESETEMYRSMAGAPNQQYKQSARWNLPCKQALIHMLHTMI
jgi:hypothetical protein